MLAGITKALHGDANLRRRPPANAFEFFNAVVRSAASSIITTQAAAQRNRFASNNGGSALATNLRVLVHHPAHDHDVGIDVGSRYVGFWSNKVRYAFHKAATQPLQFQPRELFRVDTHTTFATAEGNSDDGTFARHPERERFDFARVHVGMKSNTALGRTAGVVVANPVSMKDLQRSVIHTDRNRNFQYLLRRLQPQQSFCVQVREPCCSIKPLQCVRKDLLIMAGCHGTLAVLCLELLIAG